VHFSALALAANSALCFKRAALSCGGTLVDELEPGTPKVSKAAAGLCQVQMELIFYKTVGHVALHAAHILLAQRRHGRALTAHLVFRSEGVCKTK
jgi:hypothetical protein